MEMAGRPPPLAPESLPAAGRRPAEHGRDLGEYYRRYEFSSCACCRSMTVMPHGPAIEMWISGCCFLPLIMGIPCSDGSRRAAGTNTFDDGTFSADGMVENENREIFYAIVKISLQATEFAAFGKVETRDLAGTWCSWFSFRWLFLCWVPRVALRRRRQRGPVHGDGILFSCARCFRFAIRTRDCTRTDTRRTGSLTEV